ncbi:MAG TPA: cyclic nucleotide-binding domain-containing protein [Actinomycetota bacterium]|nr:cyclic nucleotide-binding domain-containing protein [Actinomycetota bacterium]
MPTSSKSATPKTSSKKPGVRLLARVPLFEGLSQTHLRSVATLAEEVRYSPGRMIVRTGSPGAAFYVIVEGTAKVLRGKIATAKGTWELGPGDFFGEMALLDGGPRTASVVAETALTTIRIERGPFRQMLREEPDIALKLLESMALRMRGMIGQTSV